MQKLASLSLAPGPDTVARALAWLEKVGEKEQWSPHMAFKLSLCVDEALTNILMHGFQSRDDSSPPNIALVIHACDKLLAVDIVDNGLPFDPTQRTSPELASSLDEAIPGGHGLRLMRHYLQDIQYRRDDGRNHLRLTAAVDTARSSHE